MLISIEFPWSVAYPTFFMYYCRLFCCFFYPLLIGGFSVSDSVKLKRKTIIINPSTFDKRNWASHDPESCL